MEIRELFIMCMKERRCRRARFIELFRAAWHARSPRDVRNHLGDYAHYTTPSTRVDANDCKKNVYH